MALIKNLNGHSPVFGKNCWLAETTTVIGEFSCGDNCSFWFNSVVRADVHYIKLGNKVNVQDGAVIHATYQKSPTTIGNNVSIGHNAIVHGCTIEDNCLIGMGAIVMDNCVVGEGSIIAAGAVLTQGSIVSPGSLWAGIPAKYIKPIDDGLRTGEIGRIAENYVKYSSWYSSED